jgi:antitoxin VapB
MALSIKSPEAERLARRLASATGESVTGAITTAVRERLERIEAGSTEASLRRTERLTAIAADAAPRWTASLREADHGDLLYDERGLPR